MLVFLSSPTFLALSNWARPNTGCLRLGEIVLNMAYNSYQLNSYLFHALI